MQSSALPEPNCLEEPKPMTAVSVEFMNVVFVSAWSEGEVRTCAKLDLRTGEVFDIEVSECGAEFEHLIEEYVESANGLVQAGVVRQAVDGRYCVERRDDLDAFRRPGGA